MLNNHTCKLCSVEEDLMCLGFQMSLIHYVMDIHSRYDCQALPLMVSYFSSKLCAHYALFSECVFPLVAPGEQFCLNHRVAAQSLSHRSHLSLNPTTSTGTTAKTGQPHKKETYTKVHKRRTLLITADLFKSDSPSILSIG